MSGLPIHLCEGCGARFTTAAAKDLHMALVAAAGRVCLAEDVSARELRVGDLVSGCPVTRVEERPEDNMLYFRTRPAVGGGFYQRSVRLDGAVPVARPPRPR